MSVEMRPKEMIVKRRRTGCCHNSRIAAHMPKSIQSSLESHQGGSVQGGGGGGGW